ncbi:DUF2399 domain-containing protein [Nocardia brasiliensis]|uniref:DUF2399 domain-containing protein n=1 Tax=Nocardia brasiliensis TaxID=37326 RepID=UPI0009D9D14F
MTWAAASRDICQPPLAGPAVPTPWDEQLQDAMAQICLAVHEESLLEVLSDDLGIPRERCAVCSASRLLACLRA